jgi:hemerythrin-like domain-containing protein
MKATDMLREEHRLIERLLNALEATAQKLEQGQGVPPEIFLEAVDFNLAFTDGCHHRKEENALFPALVAHGMPERTGPIAAMLREHQQGRQCCTLLREAVLRWQAGDKTARSAIVANVYEYVELRRRHIIYENNILFQMAEQVMPPGAQEEVAAAIKRIEREASDSNTKPKCQALVETLEREAWA